MTRQRTIRTEVSFTGVGLHTAHRARVRFRPAAPDTGLVFRRVDLPGCPEVKADVASLLPEEKRVRRTSIGTGAVEIHTIEHVLATVLGLEIDNLLVEMDNDEFPGADGSSRELAALLSGAGLVEQDRPRRRHELKEAVFAGSGDSQVVALPDKQFRVSYTLDYPPPLNTQFASFVISPETFLAEIAPARTFCLQDEVDSLVAAGLGKGSSYENTIVVGPAGVVGNTLRFENEMVRHKILDLMGDLGFLGVSPGMHVIAIRSGHNLNVRLVSRLVDQARREAAAAVIPPAEEFDYEMESMEAEDILKVIPHRPPFLFVDRILDIRDDRFIAGLKNVSIAEPYFAGHFPGHPVMPGVLLVEAMAQVAGVLMLRKKENRNKIAYFAAIDNVRFRNAVLPGDQLRIEVELLRIRRRIGQARARVISGKRLAAQADLMFALVDRQAG